MVQTKQTIYCVSSLIPRVKLSYCRILYSQVSVLKNEVSYKPPIKDEVMPAAWCLGCYNILVINTFYKIHLSSHS